MNIMELVFLAAYCFIGHKANMYLRYHLLGQTGVIYANTGNFIVSQIIWAILLGWLTIPLMLLHMGYKSIK